MIAPTNPLSQEVLNRLQALTPAERANYAAAIVRITVEVTREWMEHYPEGVAEFLALFNRPSGSVH